MKTSWRLFLFFAAAMTGVPIGLRAGTPTSITVVSDDNYPPYIFRDAQDQLQGILPDQWALWEKKTGVKVDLKAMDWSEAQRVMREGGADVIDTIFHTPERAQLYAFTPPYAQIEVPIFAHKMLGGLTDVASLKGFTIGIKAGDAVEEYLAARGIVSLKEYPSYEAIILAAKNEEIKVFSVDQPAAVYYLYKHGIADQFRQSFILYTGEFHRAVHKARPDLLALVQDGFKKISPHEYRSIDQKWKGSPFLLQEMLRKWGLLLLLGVCVVLFLSAAVLLLRRQVRIKTAELRANRARLENILRLAPVGICVVHRRIILEANATFCNTLGIPSADVLARLSLFATETH